VNYQQLFNTIQGYVENDFPSTTVNSSSGSGTSTYTSKEQIDRFIQEAEQRIYNSVQILALRKNVTGQTTANNKYLSTPSDWLANFSLAVIDPVTGGYEYLLNKDVNFIREAFPFPAVSGKPQYYAYFDEDSYILGPTPDAAYTMELHYFYYPQSIVVAGTSWLGDNFDSVLLYGSLLEAYTFMKGEADVIQNYLGRYSEALNLLRQLGEGKNRQDMYRTPQIRVPVR
jgi:hypothetical protein